MKKAILVCLTAMFAISLSAQSTKKVTFQGVITLLQQTVEHFTPALPATAEATGMRLVYYSCYDEGEFDSSAIYYSHNANVQPEHGETGLHKIEKTADDGCVLGIEAATSSGCYISFYNKKDYDRFFREAKAYGLLQEKDGNSMQYFINATPLQGGKIIKVSNQELFAIFMDEASNAKYYPQFMLVPHGKDELGWYTYILAIDF